MGSDTSNYKQLYEESLEKNQKLKKEIEKRNREKKYDDSIISIGNNCNTYNINIYISYNQYYCL